MQSEEKRPDFGPAWPTGSLSRHCVCTSTSQHAHRRGNDSLVSHLKIPRTTWQVSVLGIISRLSERARTACSQDQAPNYAPRCRTRLFWSSSATVHSCWTRHRRCTTYASRCVAYTRYMEGVWGDLQRSSPCCLQVLLQHLPTIQHACNGTPYSACTQLRVQRADLLPEATRLQARNP